MAGKNGLLGGIRSTFWRRVAMIFVMAPGVFCVIAWPLLKNLPAALGDAWEAFTNAYDDRGMQLIVHAWRSSWSTDWTPVD